MKTKLIIMLCLAGLFGGMQYSGALNGHSAFLPDNEVNYIISPLKQDKTNACWITTLTMLKRYKTNTPTLKIADVLNDLGGDPYKLYYDTNIGLGGKELQNFYTKAGIAYDQPQNYTVKGWFNLLKTKGPLIVDRFSFIDPVTNMVWTHVVVLVGIKLDSSNENNSTFIYIDPGTGKEMPVTFTNFLKLYEALPSTGVLKIQVAYSK